VSNKAKLAGLAALVLLVSSGGDANAADVPDVPPPNPPPPGPPAPPTVFPLPTIPPIPQPPGPGPGPTPPIDVPLPTLPPFVTPSMVLDDLTTIIPTPGFLYQIRQGDNPSKVGQSLVASTGKGSVQQWLRCITQGRYNWFTYATNASTNGFGAGRVSNVWGRINAAFLPAHENVAAAVAAGRLPQRTIAWTTTNDPNDGININNTQPKPTAFDVLGPKGYGRIYIPDAGELMPQCPPFDGALANPMPLLEALNTPVGAINAGP